MGLSTIDIENIKFCNAEINEFINRKEENHLYLIGKADRKFPFGDLSRFIDTVYQLPNKALQTRFLNEIITKILIPLAGLNPKLYELIAKIEEDISTLVSDN